MNLITVAKAAKRSGLSVSYISRACRMGYIDATKIGKAWAFTREAFDEWVRTRAQPGNPNWKRK